MIWINVLVMFVWIGVSVVFLFVIMWVDLIFIKYNDLKEIKNGNIVVIICFVMKLFV